MNDVNQSASRRMLEDRCDVEDGRVMYDWYKRNEVKAQRQRRRAASLEDQDVESPANVNISHCLINGSITNISDVKSGHDKDYVCLGCGKSLIAKKGQIKAHHFAHTSAVDLDSCGYNETTVSRHVETLAHKVGKRIIENGINGVKSISVPVIYKEREDKDAFGNPLKVHLTWPKDVENFSINYTSAQSEVNYGPVKPDVVIETEDQHFLAVEIAVSHFCDDEKTKKLNNLDLPTIEIDLSKVVSDMKKEYGVYFECFQYDERFENYIADGLRDVKNIKWVNISKAKQENMDKHLIRLMEHEKSIKQHEYNKKQKEELEKIERNRKKELAAIEIERKKAEKEKKFVDDVKQRRLNQIDENHMLANQYIEDFHNKYDISRENILDLFGIDYFDLRRKESGDFAFSCTSYLWKMLILYILTEKRKYIFPIKYIENELRRYVKIFNVNRNYDKSINHVDNCHYWRPISSFLKIFCTFNNDRKVWVVNDRIFNAFKHEKLNEYNESGDEYYELIKKQIIENLIVNDDVKLAVDCLASRTNSVDYKCVNIKVYDLEIYRSEGHAWFNVFMKFIGEHDVNLPFKGSSINIEFTGSVLLKGSYKDIIGYINPIHDENESLNDYAYVDDFDQEAEEETEEDDVCDDDFEGIEGVHYLWVDKQMVPMEYFDLGDIPYDPF